MSSFIRKTKDAMLELAKAAGLPEGTVFSTDPAAWPADEVTDDEDKRLEVLVYWNGESTDPENEYNLIHEIDIAFYHETDRDQVYDAYERTRRYIWDHKESLVESNLDPNSLEYRGTDKEPTDLPAVTQIWNFTRREDF